MIHLRWRMVNAWHCISECGHYRVTRNFVNGVETYLALFDNQPIDSASGTDSKAMRDSCQQHASTGRVEKHENGDGV